MSKIKKELPITETSTSTKTFEDIIIEYILKQLIKENFNVN
jgi:hypothetical protein